MHKVTAIPSLLAPSGSPIAVQVTIEVIEGITDLHLPDDAHELRRFNEWRGESSQDERQQ